MWELYLLKPSSMISEYLYNISYEPNSAQAYCICRQLLHSPFTIIQCLVYYANVSVNRL